MSCSTAARFGRVDGQVFGAARRRLQQQASIRVDHGGAPPMNPVALVERGVAALAALRLDDRIGKFDLAHFQNGGAGGGREGRPRRKAEGKAETIRHAGDRCNAGHADIGGDIEQPAAPRRSILSQLRAAASRPRCWPHLRAGSICRGCRPATTGWPHRARSTRARRAGPRPPTTCPQPIRYSAEMAA